MSDLYRVSYSGLVKDQIREVFLRGEHEGVSNLTAKAARWFWEELQRTPHEFGESRGLLKHAELAVRIVIVRPLVAEFAVHESTKTVFISKVDWIDPKFETGDV